MTSSNKNTRLSLIALSFAFLLTAHVGVAQYLGVTCGWQYSSQLAGPLTYPNQFNISLYNPDPGNPNATWDNWAEQLAQAGVDFVCPNLTGSQPNTYGPPSAMLPLLTALANRGLTNRIKFAIFDDNAASWVAQWNEANGRGFGYADKFDMSDTNNWKYLYDYNYKIFYQTIPDPNRFKINGRPLIIIWTGNTVTFLTNVQGNASQALTYVRQCCQRDFGFNPYIVLSQDFFSNDTTCNNPGIADASESWFIAGPAGPSYTLTTKNGVKIGVAVSEFQHTGQSGFLDPNHGQLFETGLSHTADSNALVTLCEGFTDYEEDAAMWRARNLDAGNNTLTYSQTLYDFPNQRINILREHSNWPFPPELKFEAEGCDYFGDANGGNGKTNFYRNGNIAIEATSDAGGGHDVGWIQPGEWFEWENVPMQGSQVHLQARIASPNNNGQLHFVIDGTNYPPMTLLNTGGYQTWTTVDSGPYSFARNGRHSVRIVCDTGGFNLNYWNYHDEIPVGVNINLQSKADGKWVSAASATLSANVTTPATSETFTVVDASSVYGYGCVALEALANSLYVTADTNGVLPLTANATAVGPLQAFQWTDNGDGTITLRALADNKLVTATNNPSTFPLIPSRNRNASLSETFAVTPVSTNTLSFVAQPNDSASGAAITAGPVDEVRVQALTDGITAAPGVTITISIASGSGAITGSIAITDSGGIAHFPNLQIDKTGAKTLLVSSAAFHSASSAQFNITAGSASALTVESAADGSGAILPAENVTVGTSVEAFAVLRDSSGNFISNTPAVWSLVKTTGGVAAGDLVPSANARSATFTGHSLGGATLQAVAIFTGQSGAQTVVGIPAAFATGTFTDNSILALAGTPLQELYGVSLADTSSRTTANGYAFAPYPGTNLSYGGSGAYGVAGFLGGGGTSGDAGFDAVLNNGELGINNGTLTLSNLTAGAAYNVLFLEADTRSGVGTRTYSVTCGSVTSASQSYAFQNGTPSLGGYVLCKFVATGTTQTFTNNQSGYGYQLDGVLVEKAPANTPAMITAVSYNGSGLGLFGSNGPAGGIYRVLTSTNINAPLNSWTPVATNYFNSSGAFTNTLPFSAAEPMRYYRLIQP